MNTMATFRTKDKQLKEFVTFGYIYEPIKRHLLTTTVRVITKWEYKDKYKVYLCTYLFRSSLLLAHVVSFAIYT